MLGKGILQLPFLPQQYRAKPHLSRSSCFATINVDLSKAEIECFQSLGRWEVITLAAVLRHCRGTFASLGVIITLIYLLTQTYIQLSQTEPRWVTEISLELEHACTRRPCLPWSTPSWATVSQLPDLSQSLSHKCCTSAEQRQVSQVSKLKLLPSSRYSRTCAHVVLTVC